MLKKNYEFKNVLSKGKYYSGSYIEAFIRKNNLENENLLGIAIGTKIAKATKRNHIKRLIRESYKNIESNISTGNSIVFLWKKKIDIKNANYRNIKRDIDKIFELTAFDYETTEDIEKPFDMVDIGKAEAGIRQARFPGEDLREEEPFED